jgi:hypothetical protein
MPACITVLVALVKDVVGSNPFAKPLISCGWFKGLALCLMQVLAQITATKVGPNHAGVWCMWPNHAYAWEKRKLEEFPQNVMCAYVHSWL